MFITILGTVRDIQHYSKIQKKNQQKEEYRTQVSFNLFLNAE